MPASQPALARQASSGSSTVSLHAKAAAAIWGEEPAKPSAGAPARGSQPAPGGKAPGLAGAMEVSDDSDAGQAAAIPSLEDVEHAVTMTQVAAAPAQRVTQLQTLGELNALSQSFKLEGGLDVDVSVLTAMLSAKDDLAEDDRPWTWDALFREVSLELAAGEAHGGAVGSTPGASASAEGADEAAGLFAVS